jgi:DNA ligase-1
MKPIKTYDPIYKIDSSQNIRIWYMELGEGEDTAGYRTVSGIRGGNLVTSSWHKCVPKNTGKANATTILSQAKKEIAANYTNKKNSGYFDNVDEVNTKTTFNPMLAQGFADEKINLGNYKLYSQPKLDGIRCIARADGLWTRSGKEITSVPHIWEAIKDVFVQHPNLTFDGELYNHKLKTNFNKITSIVRKTKPTAKDIEISRSLIEYHIYDVIDCVEEDLIFEERNKRYLKLLPKTESIVKVETFMILDEDHMNSLYASYIEDGYEGQMIRRNKEYENKRSHNLIKRKEFKTEEFKVTGIEEGLGNWAGHAKRFILETNDGKPFGSGVRGNQELLKDLYDSVRKPKWATIRFFDYTPDGIPRFPVAIDWGFDKIRTD